MKFRKATVTVIFSLYSFSFSWGQENQKKIDSILSIIKESKVDTLKARNYLELSNLTMYNDQNKTSEFLEKADSLYKKTIDNKGIVKLYAQKANYFYRLGSIDSARYYLVNSVDMSLSIGDTLRAAVIKNNIGILDHYQGNSTSASDIMNEIIPVFDKYGDSLHLANAFLMKGKIAMTDGYYNIALKETYSALKIHKDIKDNFRIAEDLLQIGLIYQTTEEHQGAIEIFNESIDFYSKGDNDQNIGQVLNFMAISNIKLKKFNRAEDCLKEALSISKKLDYKSNIARVYSNLGDIELAKSNISKAIENYEKSLVLWKSIGSPSNEANVLFSLGRAYLKGKNYSRSDDYLNQSLAIANSLKDPEIVAKVLFEKSIALERLDKYEESLSSLRKNKSISDSIFTIERAKATQELKTIYETEKKEQQIALQEKEITVLEQNAKLSNLQRILMGIGLLMALIGFYALRQKMKRNKLEKAKIDAELAFKKKELTTHALHLAKKNEVLESVKQKAKALKLTASPKVYQQLIQTIKFDQQDDKNWENFTHYFEQVHKDFASNIKTRFPEVTKNELRLMALLKMNLSSKEIANILNISIPGVKKARNRLRKKLNIAPQDSLEALVISI